MTLHRNTTDSSVKIRRAPPPYTVACDDTGNIKEGKL